jgi:hypothetical protein
MDEASVRHLIQSPRSAWGVSFPPYSKAHFAFCTAFSLHVARAYLSGQVDFEGGDRAMNNLYSYSYHDEDRGMPEFARDIFDAFDQGEYYHSGDSRQIDPAETYTKPMLHAALEQYAGVGA